MASRFTGVSLHCMRRDRWSMRCTWFMAVRLNQIAIYLVSVFLFRKEDKACWSVVLFFSPRIFFGHDAACEAGLTEQVTIIEQIIYSMLTNLILISQPRSVSVWKTF